MYAVHSKKSGFTTFSLHKRGFTLIELLVVIAITGILAGAILVAINPAKRQKQARDAIRKQDINSIANALVSYYTLGGNYPGETYCDTSIGSHNTTCPPNIVHQCWTGCNGAAVDGDYSSRIYLSLVTLEKSLKKLPVDPVNSNIYHYKYEPLGNLQTYCLGPIANEEISKPSDQTTACYYWIGAKLEAPQGNIIFRCTDIPMPAGSGCKEIDYGSDNFDSANTH